MKHTFKYIASAILMLSAASCVSNLDADLKKNYPKIERVEILADGNPISGNFLIGRHDSSQFDVVVYPTDLNVKDIRWTSSDTSALKITPSGLLTASSFGKSTISAFIEVRNEFGYAFKLVPIDVKVRNIALEELSIGSDKPIENDCLNMQIGDRVRLFPVLNPSDANHKIIKWETFNRSIAIDEEGILTARDDGRYRIRLTAVSLDDEFSEKDTLTTELKVQVGDVITFADPEMEKICIKYYDSNKDGYVSYSEAEKATYWAEHYCKNNSDIKSFNEFKNFKNINILSVRAFLNCDNLEEITIPQNITTISTYAFSNCYNLKKVTLLGDVKKIASLAFANCYNLETINIPKSLEIIENNAFGGDEKINLTHLYLPNIKEVGVYSFTEIPNLTKITFGQNIIRLAKTALLFCSNLTDVIFEGENPPECGTISTWSIQKINVHVPNASKEKYKKKYLFKDTWTTSNELDLVNDIIRFPNNEIKGVYVDDMLITSEGEEINHNQIIRIEENGKSIPVILKEHVTKTVGYHDDITIIGY